MEEKNISKIKDPLRLPFTAGGSGDAGEWAYNHRVGLCVTVIAYLLAGIIFMSAKIAVGQKQQVSAFYVDLVDERKPDRQTPEVREIAAATDYSDIHNRISNENATRQGSLDDRLRDDRGTDASRIYEEAREAQERMRGNREAWERGLGEDRATTGGNTQKDDAKREDVRMKGRVTVEFSLINPLRTSVKLVVPAYKCEGGGEVVVSITVNNNGSVTDAGVSAASTTADRCMADAALAAARASRFNVDPSAPKNHTGTISYIFIPQ